MNKYKPINEKGYDVVCVGDVSGKASWQLNGQQLMIDSTIANDRQSHYAPGQIEYIKYTILFDVRPEKDMPKKGTATSLKIGDRESVDNMWVISHITEKNKVGIEISNRP
jgi:hypothetical protein